ncbi:indolepyruvate ferredoxin oxidoreductase alpha subunit [Dendrosporobacter quercicolus]|uniref:Indolepyruvate oxidoreductase subunit IorA n=2 Tax=Dendrosporobacter quercicolus TaxID=146817 RepID=A0A1G9QKJ8_9FIRM|nr:indolepyruvate ferredoxin oxidoreductase alpha subunit [Dendrosporobacter quercicolus]
MAMKQLMTGNEAIARGAYEAGIRFAAAYPGTPSTEILENIALYKDDIVAEWAPNEKVALESAIGFSYAGGRAFASMKQVGLNVAADPLFSFAYTGGTGGIVIVTADEPGIHSSQTEQDNRYYAKIAKVPMLEPADSQQAKDMVVAGIQLSERYRVPVLIRMTTRVCHSKSIVERNEPVKANLAEYKKNIWQYTTIPAVSQLLRKELEKKLIDLHKESNDSPFNKIEWNDKKIGIIASGIACEYAKEVFKKEASYLCLGFTNPLPMEMITEFASAVDNLYLIEELEPYLEEQIKAAGIHCIGKDKVPNIGELSPHILRKAFKGIKRELIPTDSSKLVHRPPMLCAGCPHRGVFYVLGKRNDIFISGDIGCYGLGALPPLNAMDTCLCMGASISSGHGVAKAFKEYNIEKRSVCVIGDSTFFHSGMTGLLNVVYNASQTITIILDNRITGMTGHQDHPGTGFTAQGKPAKEANIEQIVRALGIEQVRAINPLNLKQMQAALEWALAFEAPSVIIARWPCALKKLSAKDKEEFDGCFTKCIVDQAVCTGCKKCVRIGCPALRFDKQKKQAFINATMCAGCGICAQICPIEAIVS